jgi:small-conductance mechanosensitive channel
MLAIFFYDLVLSLHIAAILIAFGVTFAYPVLIPYLMRHHPRTMPAIHEAQDRIGKLVITPAATVALLAGAYLATDRHYWSEVWVTVPLIVLIVLLGLGGAFFAPNERKAAQLAARDVAASADDGEVAWSLEYQAISRRIAIVGALASALVLVAVFFMTTKP